MYILNRYGFIDLYVVFFIVFVMLFLIIKICFYLIDLLLSILCFDFFNFYKKKLRLILSIKVIDVG